MLIVRVMKGVLLIAEMAHNEGEFLLIAYWQHVCRNSLCVARCH